jgi:hypothetical protein
MVDTSNIWEQSTDTPSQRIGIRSDDTSEDLFSGSVVMKAEECTLRFFRERC